MEAISEKIRYSLSYRIRDKALAGDGCRRLWSNWRYPALSRRCQCLQRSTRIACRCAEPPRPREASCSYVPRGRIHMSRRCDHRPYSGRTPVATCQRCRIHRNAASQRRRRFRSASESAVPYRRIHMWKSILTRRDCGATVERDCHRDGSRPWSHRHAPRCRTYRRRTGVNTILVRADKNVPGHAIAIVHGPS